MTKDSCGILEGVGLITNGIEAELGVTARPGRRRVETGELADSAGDAERTKSTVDHVVN